MNLRLAESGTQRVRCPDRSGKHRPKGVGKRLSIAVSIIRGLATGAKGSVTT
jgi:hypothetical protein